GNWAFNVAYASQSAGLRAYVVRLDSIAELEEWVHEGVPVVLSVAYDLLTGKGERRDSGHLLVCVGFTNDGEVVVNDPWARLDRGESVRKTFSRDNLQRAWNVSHNTVYLIYPKSWKTPSSLTHRWQ